MNTTKCSGGETEIFEFYAHKIIIGRCSLTQLHSHKPQSLFSHPLLGKNGSFLTMCVVCSSQNAILYGVLR